MKEKILFFDKIDYVFEAYQLLVTLASPRSGEYDKYRQAITEKYGVNSEHVRKCLDLGERGMRRYHEKYPNRMADVTKYFGEIENGIIPGELVLCSSGLMLPGQEPMRNTEWIRKNYEELSEARRDAAFLKNLAHDMEPGEFDKLVGCEERGVFVEKAERVRNIFGYIQKLELKPESKVQIFDLYLNQDAYFNPICELMDEAITIFCEEEEALDALCQEWAVCWKKIVDENRFFEMLSGVVELDKDAVAKGICVMPMVVLAAGMFVSIHDKVLPWRDNEISTCRIGVMMTEEFNWKVEQREEYRWESMIPLFKALGDNSKADILMFIKDKPAYGSEIAKQFSLTTATVSHHMNKLVNLRIVQTEMRDGRVYYLANKERLCEIFNQCKKLFE